jgi:ABC-2 type transport system ATP-binding protein
MKDPAIIIQNLVKKFEDVTAVDNLTLEIERTELFGLLGPNGAGKTTTINVLCGLLKPTSGVVKVGGHDVQREAAKVKELIGVCPQDSAVYPYLSGRENVELFGNLHAMPKNKLSMPWLREDFSTVQRVGRVPLFLHVFFDHFCQSLDSFIYLLFG